MARFEFSLKIFLSLIEKMLCYIFLYFYEWETSPIFCIKAGKTAKLVNFWWHLLNIVH